MGLHESSRKHASIERELNEERVAALMRISRTLESLIEQLQALAEDSRSHHSEHYARLQARARQYRWFLEVQREALGLRDHRILDDVYPIPA